MGDSLVQRRNKRRDKIARLHVDQLIKNQNEMRKAGLNCDCTLEMKWSGRTRSSQVHYAVVSAASEYCRWNSECENGKWNVVVDLETRLFIIGSAVFELKAMEEALEQCIEFMYIGKADIRHDAAGGITRLSHILQLKPLEDMGLETMHDNLTTFESCSWLRMAARYCKRSEYEAKANKKWISLNLQQIPGLNECSPENLWRSAADLFQNLPHFSCWCEMLAVLKVIEIEKADCKFLLDVVITNKKVTRDPAAARYVSEIICQKINRQPSNLNHGNYYKIKNLLAEYGSDDTTGLKVRLKKFMINNFNALAQQDGFLETDQDEVTSIFSSPQLTCTEKIKFDSMGKWAKHKPEERAENFLELFKLIKLQNLSEEELINIGQILLAENYPALVSPVFEELENKRKHLPVKPDTARWVVAQRPECDNSSNASLRSMSTPSNGISNFSTASLREDLASSVTSSDSGAPSSSGYREYNVEKPSSAMSRMWQSLFPRAAQK